MLGAATAVAAFGLCGCTPRDASEAAPPPVQAPTAGAPAADPGPLPAAESLTAVMSRLADPGVPGAEKLGLVEDATPPDAATLDRFAAALRDGGFTPARFTASEMRWSDSHPGDVIATITASGPQSTATTADAGQFAFPMEFRPHPGGWQLTRDTAEMLLAFGNARTETPVPAPAPPTR